MGIFVSLFIRLLSTNLDFMLNTSKLTARTVRLDNVLFLLLFNYEIAMQIKLLIRLNSIHFTYHMLCVFPKNPHDYENELESFFILAVVSFVSVKHFLFVLNIATAFRPSIFFVILPVCVALIVL